VKERVTEEKGNGLFVMEVLQKGGFIIKYVGKIVYKEQDNNYGMKITDMDLWIDLTKNEGQAKYINHSCDPNCNLEQWDINGMPRMYFFANRKINSRTELTFNYYWTVEVKNTVEWRRKGTKCMCGALNCHKVIKRGILLKKKRGQQRVQSMDHTWRKGQGL
jgi:histone-lysine N-methyltransferase ASH1L